MRVTGSEFASRRGCVREVLVAAGFMSTGLAWTDAREHVPLAALVRTIGLETLTPICAGALLSMSAFGIAVLCALPRCVLMRRGVGLVVSLASCSVLGTFFVPLGMVIGAVASSGTAPTLGPWVLWAGCGVVLYGLVVSELTVMRLLTRSAAVALALEMQCRRVRLSMALALAVAGSFSLTRVTHDAFEAWVTSI